MNSQGASGTGRGNTPPYVSYPSFRTLISEFHDHDIPTRIDRSVLTRFSGIVGTQLLTALRFLALINDKSEPTDRLRELAAAYGTGDWAQTLLAVLRQEYAAMFELDLGAATSSHFTETFRKAFPPGSDAVAQKCIAFFLGAVRDTGIAISERVLKGRKPRAAPSTPPRRRPHSSEKPMKPGGSQTKANGKDDDETQTNVDAWHDRLIEKFPAFNPQWDAAVQAKWFESFEKLMAIRK
jgi:hypothetical protein